MRHQPPSAPHSTATTVTEELVVESAGLGRRSIAFALDALLLCTIVMGASFGMMRPIAPQSTAPHNPLDQVVEAMLQHPDDLVGVSMLALGLMLALPVVAGLLLGRTPGAHIMGITSIDGRGLKPTAIRTFIRALIRVIGGLALGLGWLWALMDPERRTLHDRLTGVWVIHCASVTQPTKTESEQFDP
jgi:uncharacterized RDD family membrane protein YckC